MSLFQNYKVVFEPDKQSSAKIIQNTRIKQPTPALRLCNLKPILGLKSEGIVRNSEKHG